MKTNKRPDASGPESPWNEVVPGLWIGGHYWTDPAGFLRPVVVAAEFDLVISLYTRSGHGPDLPTEHVVCRMPDALLTAEQIRSVQGLAVLAARAVQDGRTTLVRCHSGYNRSGLVVAQALIRLGHDPDAAVALLRQKRSPLALSNPTFVQYLATGLDVAYLLSGLEAPA